MVTASAFFFLLHFSSSSSFSFLLSSSSSSSSFSFPLLLHLHLLLLLPPSRSSSPTPTRTSSPSSTTAAPPQRRLLYQIRLLSASQRTAAARFIVENRSDGKGTNKLGRAMKDFPSRRGEKRWEHSRNPEQRKSVLEQALSVAESERAKTAVLEELKGEDGVEEGEIDASIRKKN